MTSAREMTLSLPADLGQFVEDEAKRGDFASSGGYVRDLIRERFLHERDRAAKLKALENALARGLADAEAGRVVPLEEAFQRLKAELEQTDPTASAWKWSCQRRL